MTSTDSTFRHGPATEPTPVQRRRLPRRTGMLIAAPVGVLTAVTVTTLALWAAGTDRPASPPSTVLTNPPAAYQPGGSVYDQQVPDALNWAAGYGPGSYLYTAQVPQLQSNVRMR